MSGKSAIDPSLLELFQSELEVHLPTLSAGLLLLEKNPGTTSHLDSLMRAAHSLKGAARIVGLDQTVHLTHVLEDCFVAAQEGRIRLNSDSVDVLLKSLDLLPRVAQPTVDPADVAMVQTLVEALTAVKDNQLKPAVRPTPTPPPIQEKPVPFEKAAATRKSAAAGQTLIQVPERLDAEAAEQLRERLVKLLRKRVATIQLDFARVAQVDPTGLALLAGAAKRARSGSRPTKLVIRNAATSVRQLLQQTRLDQVLTVS